MAKKTQKKRYWFKAKKYGWGWVPATWEGWLVLMAFVLFITDYALRVDRGSLSASDTLYALFLPIVVGVSVLILICYLTGEPPRWQWGEKSTSKKKRK